MNSAVSLRARARPLVTLALLLVFSTAIGCARRYTIVPGLWKLEFTNLTKYYRDRRDRGGRREEPLRFPADRVEIVVNHNDDVETVEVYLIEINPDVDAPSRRDIPPLTGTIEGRKIRLDGRDDGWTFVMTGQVVSEERMKGILYGRPTLLEDSTAQGNWTLDKIPEDPDF